MTSISEDIFYSLCPQCTSNVPSIELVSERERIISIKCKCGYENELSISSYIKAYSKNKIKCNESLYKCIKHNNKYTLYCNSCDKKFCSKCAYANEKHKLQNLDCTINATKNDSNFNKMISYLKSLRNKAISMINKLKEEIEKSYMNCYTMNNEIYSLLQIIRENCINNNQKVQENYSKIKGERIWSFPYRYKCENESIEGIIDYFKRFSFKRGLLHISSLKSIYPINKKKSNYQTICLLNDRRIAASKDYKIYIYNLRNSNEFITMRSDIKITQLAQLDNNSIIGLCTNNNLKIWNDFKLKHIIYNKNHLYKIIALSSNRILGISKLFLFIWKENCDFNAPLTIETLLDYKSEYNEAKNKYLYMRGKEVLISYTEGYIVIRSMLSYQIINLIKEDANLYNPLFVQVDNDRIMMSLIDCVKIINISKGVTEYKDSKIEVTVKKLLNINTSTILIEYEDGYSTSAIESNLFMLYNINTKEWIKFERVGSQILDLIRIDDNMIAINSFRSPLQIWSCEYEYDIFINQEVINVDSSDAEEEQLPFLNMNNANVLNVGPEEEEEQSEESESEN